MKKIPKTTKEIQLYLKKRIKTSKTQMKLYVNQREKARSKGDTDHEKYFDYLENQWKIELQTLKEMLEFI